METTDNKNNDKTNHNKITEAFIEKFLHLFSPPDIDYYTLLGFICQYFFENFLEKIFWMRY